MGVACEEAFNCKAGEQRSVGKCRLKPENIIKVVVSERVSRIVDWLYIFRGTSGGLL